MSYSLYILKSQTADKYYVGISQNPELRWDAGGIEVGNPILIGDTLHMWYAGSKPLPYVYQIGLAKSHFEPVSVEQETIQPTTFTLEQNYPNPFNPSTTIKYSVPELNKVKLTLFNLLGEEVTILVNEEKTAGIYLVKFDATELPSGVYFYQLKAENFISTKKMLLVK